MASWFFSLSELAALAKAHGAFFVEPCVKKGRLLSCDRLMPNSTALRLSDVIDIETLKKYHPLIIAHDEFYHRVGNDTLWYKSCGCTKSDKHRPCCKLPQKEAFNSAIAAADGGAQSVFQVERYRKAKSLSETTHQLKREYLFFRREHREFVDQVLEKAGISEFSAIQWRGEVHSLSYDACAKQIVKSR
eukprot:Selendium_serpulae@DN9393_c0_g1_i1.p1